MNLMIFDMLHLNYKLHFFSDRKYHGHQIHSHIWGLQTLSLFTHPEKILGWTGIGHNEHFICGHIENFSHIMWFVTVSVDHDPLIHL